MENKFLKWIEVNGNRSTVIDFDALFNDWVPIDILITERGKKGKTFNGKEWALDRFIETGFSTVWLMNTEIQIEQEKSKFLVNHHIVNELKWKDVERKGNSYYKDGVLFLQMVSLSTSEKLKGSRDLNIKYVIYDEFNVGLRQIANDQTFLFENLMATFNDIKGFTNEKLKVFIFGNNKSLFTPLFVSWEIYEIKDEITLINDEYGKPLIRIFVPNSDRNAINIEHKDDWTYQLGKRSGTADFIFNNENIYDDINGIEPPDFNQGSFVSTYKIKQRLFDLYQKRNKKGSTYYYLMICDGIKNSSGLAVTLHTRDIEPGSNHKPTIRKHLIEMLSEDKLKFDSIATKSTLITVFR